MTKHIARRKPRKKKPPSFLDTVLEMLTSTAGTVAFGAGAVLLGKLLGEPVRGRIELPPGLPPEIEAEWRRLAGMPAVDAEVETKPEKVGGRRKRIPEPPAEVVNLKKGSDGVYRPEETEWNASQYSQLYSAPGCRRKPQFHRLSYGPEPLSE